MEPLQPLHLSRLNLSFLSYLLPLLLNDLEKEGLFKLGDKALFLSGGDDEVTVSSYSQTVIETDMLLVSTNDQEMQNVVPDDTFDFAFAHSHHIDSTEFIDRTLKVGGILTVQLNLQDLPPSFLKHPNYDIVYVKSSEYTVMTMRKTGETEQKQSLAATGRKLLSLTEENATEKPLKKLEDVLFEPPRAASRKSRTYFKRTRYLPDLMGDNLDLESYSRRVFIDVSDGKGSSGTEWFVENYPTRKQKFEIYKIETVNDEMISESEKMDMTEWLKENVKEEEYVVMKAEAEVVEEMMRSSKSIKKVDELFLECKPKGLGLRGRKMQSKSGRAYWECLALYGKLRDEGVAVQCASMVGLKLKNMETELRDDIYQTSLFFCYVLFVCLVFFFFFFFSVSHLVKECVAVFKVFCGVVSLGSDELN